MDYAVSLE